MGCTVSQSLPDVQIVEKPKDAVRSFSTASKDTMDMSSLSLDGLAIIVEETEFDDQSSMSDEPVEDQKRPAAVTAHQVRVTGNYEKELAEVLSVSVDGKKIFINLFKSFELQDNHLIALPEVDWDGHGVVYPVLVSSVTFFQIRLNPDFKNMVGPLLRCLRCSDPLAAAGRHHESPRRALPRTGRHDRQAARQRDICWLCRRRECGLSAQHSTGGHQCPAVHLIPAPTASPCSLFLSATPAPLCNLFSFWCARSHHGCLLHFIPQQFPLVCHSPT